MHCYHRSPAPLRRACREEEEARCVACGSEEKEEVAMLECSRCLGGWHLTCLDPPLADVPEVRPRCRRCEASVCMCGWGGGVNQQLLGSRAGSQLGMQAVEGVSYAAH